MNKANIKGFLFSKNTITILLVFAGIIGIYFWYNSLVSQAVTFVSVPVAKSDISPRSEITDEVIYYVRVPRNKLKEFGNVETNPKNIIGKLANYNCAIPTNSFFFREMLVKKEELSDPSVDNIADGYTVFTLPVTLESTLGNSIYPGNYIDLYIAGIGDTGKIIYGKLIESIEVLDVKDKNGQRVFESTTEERIPTNLLFAVPDDYHQLLEKAKRVTSINIVPVLRNKSYTSNPTETAIVSTYLKNWILSKAETIIQDTKTNKDNTSSTDRVSSAE